MNTENQAMPWSEKDVQLLIAKNKQLTRIIEEKDTIFNEILESSMAGYWDWHIQDDYEYLSPTFKKMFGYEDHELPNHPSSWQKIIHPDDLDGVFKIYNAHVESKGEVPFANTVRYYHKDGSIVWVFCKGKVIKWDADGKPVRMVGSHVNITPLKDSERKLKQTKQNLIKQTARYQLVTDIAQIGIWELNLETYEATWDHNMHKIYGLKKNGPPPGFEEWISDIVHPDDAARIEQYMQEVIQEEKVKHLQFKIKTKDTGEEKIITAVTSVYKDSFGTPIKLVGTNIDLTRDISLERQKLKTKALEKQNKELEQFAYVASHDLQEPLRTVDNFVGLIQKMYSDVVDQQGQKFLHLIQKATNRMSDLVKGLLDYSRIGMQKKLSKVDINKVIHNILEDIGTMIMEEEANIIVQEDLPTISAYPLEIRILFQNLIINAIKFHKPEQKPNVEISSSENESHWIFKIKDNGIGISPKDQEKIFLIFQRLHHPNDYEGNGIGLAHCQKITDIHMGEIWVKSEEGKGSTFFFSVQKRLIEN
jgi:two-component system CheB/CheR fusion protein